jgi:hypothetical protein
MAGSDVRVAAGTGAARCAPGRCLLGAAACAGALRPLAGCNGARLRCGAGAVPPALGRGEAAGGAQRVEARLQRVEALQQRLDVGGGDVVVAAGLDLGLHAVRQLAQLQRAGQAGAALERVQRAQHLVARLALALGWPTGAARCPVAASVRPPLPRRSGTGRGRSRRRRRGLPRLVHRGSSARGDGLLRRRAPAAIGRALRGAGTGADAGGAARNWFGGGAGVKSKPGEVQSSAFSGSSLRRFARGSPSSVLRVRAAPAPPRSDPSGSRRRTGAAGGALPRPPR